MYILSGTVYGDSDKTATIARARVRLYSKDDGALVDTTTTNRIGAFSFSVADLASPYKYFAVAYSDTYKAGIVDIFKTYYTVAYANPMEIVSSNYDLFIVDLPYPSQNKVTRFEAYTLWPPTSTGTVELRNAPAGGGDGFSLTIDPAVDSYYWSSDCVLSTTSKYYIRVTTAFGLIAPNFSVVFQAPELVDPY